MIALIDYDAGNMRSVEKALIALGEKPVIARDRDTLLKADKVILPGVGAYADCMDRLREYDLISVINEIVENKTPFLGICLGMQLMFEDSEECNISVNVKRDILNETNDNTCKNAEDRDDFGLGKIPGLGLIKGHIIKIPDTGLKIPHMGWNSLKVNPKSRLLKGISDGDYVYFVHSYYLEADDVDVVAATTEYGCEIHAAVEKDNLFGCQFHPEKSSELGQLILKNFIEL